MMQKKATLHGPARLQVGPLRVGVEILIALVEGGVRRATQVWAHGRTRAAIEASEFGAQRSLDQSRRHRRSAHCEYGDVHAMRAGACFEASARDSTSVFGVGAVRWQRAKSDCGTLSWRAAVPARRWRRVAYISDRSPLSACAAQVSCAGKPARAVCAAAPPVRAEHSRRARRRAPSTARRMAPATVPCQVRVPSLGAQADASPVQGPGSSRPRLLTLVDRQDPRLWHLRRRQGAEWTRHCAHV